MKTYRSLLLSTLLALGLPASAQKEEPLTPDMPHAFVSFQGGLLRNYNGGDVDRQWSPMGAVSIGYFFNKVIGLRLQGSFSFWKASLPEGNSYNSMFASIDADALVNLNKLVFPSCQSPLQVTAVIGLPLHILLPHIGSDGSVEAPLVGSPFEMSISHIWVKNNLNSHANYNMWNRGWRGGAIVGYNLNNRWNINLEGGAQYVQQTDGIVNNEHWWPYLMAGVNYNFGFHRPKKAEVPATAAVAVETPKSLYEQMQSSVDDRMNVWMRRIKGESKAEYRARISDDAIATKRLEYVKEVSTDMAGNRINTNVRDLRYDTEAQLLGIEFSDMPSIVLIVPQSEVQGIRSAHDLQFANTVYNLTPGNQFEVLYTEAINPVNGKKYQYISTAEGKHVSISHFLPLTAAQQSIENTTRLQQITAKAVEAAKEQNLIDGNTTITVTTKLVPTEQGKADYHINYVYTVKDGFSVMEDFAPGKYEADKTKASNALLKIVAKTLEKEYANYLGNGKAVQIEYFGSADAKPIRRAIAYNGRFGKIQEQVSVNGKPETLSVSSSSGIVTNEELSLVRAVSVKDFIHKNIPALKDMQVKDVYHVEVSADEGAEYRRVYVNFVFYDAPF